MCRFCLAGASPCVGGPSGRIVPNTKRFPGPPPRAPGLICGSRGDTLNRLLEQEVFVRWVNIYLTDSELITQKVGCDEMQTLQTNKVDTKLIFSHQGPLRSMRSVIPDILCQ